MKYTLLKWLYIILYYFGIFELFYFFRRTKQVVVTYHNIISDDIFSSDFIHLGVSCSEASFIEQINRISSKFHITTEVGLPGTCIISFDDGYKNNITIAAHLLHAKNISALFFIPACYFESNHALWVDQLLMWVSYIPPGNYLLLEKKFLITENSISRHLLWRYLYRNILSNYSILESLMKELNNCYPFSDLKKIIDKKMYRLRFEPMNFNDLIELKKMGHKVGCHSYKHDILSLLDNEQLEHDFSVCAAHAKEYNTNYYSYPFGGKDEVSNNVITKCKKYNYLAAFLNYETNDQNIYSLGRMTLGNEINKYFIEARLSGFEKFLKILLNKFFHFKKIIKSEIVSGSG